MAAGDDQKADSRRGDATDPNYPPPPQVGERASHPGSVAPASGARGVDTAPGGIQAPAPAPHVAPVFAPASSRSDPPQKPPPRSPNDASIVVAPDVLSPAAPAARIPGMNDSIDELMNGFAEPLLPRRRSAQSAGADIAAYQGASRPAAAHNEAKLPPIVVDRKSDTGPGHSRDLDETALGGRKRRRRILLAVLLPAALVGGVTFGIYSAGVRIGVGTPSGPVDPSAVATAAVTNVRPLATGVIMPTGNDAIPPPPADTETAPSADTATRTPGRRSPNHPLPVRTILSATTSQPPAVPTSPSALPKNDMARTPQ